jgi:thioredoxin reductase (NADPH)
MADPDVFDVAIIGAGPAGLAAALYTSRDRYSTLLLEKSGLPGGQIMLTERIDNYPGLPRVAGPQLIQNMVEQVRQFGAEISTGQELTGLSRRSDGLLHLIINEGEKEYNARAVILSPGSSNRQLGVPGEMEMRQAGKVSYCATCDGAFYRGKNVLTVGGGNTAVEDTMYLASRFVKEATLVHRRREFRAQKVLVEELLRAAQDDKVRILAPYVLTKIVGDVNRAEIDYVEVRHVETGQTEKLKVDGVFIFVGMVPNTGFLKDVVGVNALGYIECDPVCLRTKLRGVFAAGDCRVNAPMQLATACGDGVTAAMMLKEYFRNPDWWESGGMTATGIW